MRGSSVTVQSLNDHLVPTGQTFDVVTTDDQGDFAVPASVTSQYVEIIASGYYFDELTNRLSSAPLTLRAIADVTVSGTVDVNLLTSMSEPLARVLVLQGADFAQAIQQADSTVLSSCGFSSALQFSFSNVDFTRGGTSGAALLAASLIVERYALSLGGSEVADLTQLLSQVGAAAADSGGNAALRALNDALCETIQSIDVAAVRANLTAYYASIGAAVTIPAFEPLIAATGKCSADGGRDASVRDSGAEGGSCTTLSCITQGGPAVGAFDNRLLRCGTLEDACGHSLNCGLTCNGMGTCGTLTDPHACTCGACGVCGPGEVWYQNYCCLLNTCATNPITGEGPHCGNLNDNCGGMLQCPMTCPTGGVCGAQGIAILCTCWIADYESAYPCPPGKHNYDCEGGHDVLMPTVPGCVANPTDSSRWCCP